MDDPAGEATTLKNLGIAYRVAGRYGDAVEYLHQAEAKRAEAGAEPDPSILANTGTLYERLGADTLALRCYEKQLREGERRKDRGEIRDARTRMGWLFLARGRPQQAVGALEPVVAWLGARATASEAWTLQLWSDALRGVGRSAEALEAERKRLEMCRLVSAQCTADALTQLGFLQLEDDPNDAERVLVEALELAGREQLPTPFERLGLARLWRRRGDLERAVQELQESLRQLELTRAQAASPEKQTLLAADFAPIYDELIELLVERGGHEDGAGAFAILEQAHARALLEAVTVARLDEENANSELTDRRNRLRAAIAEHHRQLEKETSAAAATAETQERLEKLEIELDQVMGMIRRAPQIHSVKRPRPPLTLEQARGLLDARTALVEYCVTSKQVLAFVVTQADFSAGALQTSADSLGERIDGYLELLTRSGTNGWQAVSLRLRRELWEPVRRRIPAAIEQIVLIPDGVLDSLPFETLLDAQGRALLDEFAVSYAPSATILAELQSLAPTGTDELLLLADPLIDKPAGEGRVMRSVYEDQGFELAELPFSSVEAAAIADLAGTKCHLFRGREASEQRVKGLDLRRFAILHFATHALLSDRSPLHSAMLLAAAPGSVEDGFLQAREISTLRLDAELVVLSGCRSARGRILNGEGVQGLSRAFFWAGARSILASLWDVSDRSTSRLIQSFYRGLAAGESEAEALRHAKLRVRADPETSDPRHWGGFVLLGDGSRKVLIGDGQNPADWRIWTAAVLACGIAIGFLALRQSRRGPS